MVKACKTRVSNLPDSWEQNLWKTRRLWNSVLSFWCQILPRTNVKIKRNCQIFILIFISSIVKSCHLFNKPSSQNKPQPICSQSKRQPICSQWSLANICRHCSLNSYRNSPSSIFRLISCHLWTPKKGRFGHICQRECTSKYNIKSTLFLFVIWRTVFFFDFLQEQKVVSRRTEEDTRTNYKSISLHW